jgi:hypothetical protein
MNQEQNLQEHTGEVVGQEPSVLNSVTPLSKYLAMLLFIALPFVGGYLGYSFSPEKVIEREILVSVKDTTTVTLPALQIEDGLQVAKSASFDQVLENEKLGIRLQVPSKIMAYANLETEGCEQKLILGVPTETSVFLMPEKSSCEPNAELLTEANSFENSLTKKIEIIPVQNTSEIAGIVKEKIANNTLISLNNSSSSKLIDGAKCFESLNVSIEDVVVGSQFGTLPVNVIVSNDCGSLNPHVLSVRYSPAFKKAVFIESLYGTGENGVYYFDFNKGYFDLDVYNTLELLR